MSQSHFLCYARGGKEFEVEQALRDMGVDVWCGRKIVFKRTGNKRYAEGHEEPKLPNYIFACMTLRQWHEAQSIKHLRPEFHLLRRDDIAELQRFRGIVDVDHQEGLRIASNADAAAVAQYEAGQELIDLRGRFGETVLKFRRIIERSHNPHPMIRAEVDMMGQIVSVDLDPLDVKEA